MNREKTVQLALAALCVVALAVAAATIVEPDTAGGGSSSVVNPNDDAATGRTGEGGSANADPLTDPGEFAFSFAICLPFLLSGEFFALVVLLAGGLWLSVERKHDSLAATGLIGAVGLPGFLLWLFLTNCGVQNEPEPFSIIPSEVTPPTRGDSSSLGFAQNPGNIGAQLPLLLLLFGGFVVLATVGYLLWLDPEDEDDEDLEDETYAPVETDQSTGQRMAALGAAAGRAATRLENDEPVDNAVYRAWREMTTHLDVAAPESSTPAEFERAAVDAGMARADVRELTDLFEQVRYGGRTVTDDVEARAVDALRSIESEYARTDEPRAGSE
ncbi:DUF4129 domain-containing protein [Haloarchaeobius sp. DFWS5]|uniref:DUF4129 domain-containing protein n=1 Tax=Haloarchaeobius sp. DFWS5 TaxID=3446114 RepID=UPI003EB7CF55